MNQGDAYIFAQGATGLALAASALAEAAQALSEAAVALSAISREEKAPLAIDQPFTSTTNVTKTREMEDEEHQYQHVDDDDDGSSISAHGRNNAHWKDSIHQVTSDNDCPGDLSLKTSHSHAGHEPFSGQEQLDTGPLGELLCPGRFYVVLEEEFDALPLICAYATVAKRTACYVPTSGSLSPWESILSGIIPDREVRSAISFLGTSILRFDDVVRHLASSDEGSVLVLRPAFIVRANENKAHSASDGLIFWGLPGSKYWPNLVQAIQQSNHSLLILNEREYHDTTWQNFLLTQKLGPGFVAHPQSLEINSTEPKCMLQGFREHVHRIVINVQYSQNVQTIYEDLLESPIDDTTQLNFVTKNSVDRIDIVNKFMLRVFLRERVYGGSSRFILTGRELHIPGKTHIKLGAIFSRNNTQSSYTASTSWTDTNVKPEPRAWQNTAPPRNFLDTTQYLGRWRVTLQQDTDAIPLICYLSQQHPKSLCAISYSRSAFAYGDLFSKVCTCPVGAPGQKQASIKRNLQLYSRASQQSGLCLLSGQTPGGASDYDEFKNIRADALIYWGLPSNLWPNLIPRDQFNYIYLIIPPDQSSTRAAFTSDFIEHPTSTLLNAQGPDSELHLVRERVRPALFALSRGSLCNITYHYIPANSTTYTARDFIRKVFMRHDYR